MLNLTQSSLGYKRVRQAALMKGSDQRIAVLQHSALVDGAFVGNFPQVY